MIDAYYTKLTRSFIIKAVESLGQAQEYMIEAKVPDHDQNRINRIVSGLNNYHKQLGNYLRIKP